MKRRVLALAMVGVMVFGLTACGKKDGDNTTTTAGDTNATSAAESTTEAQPVSQTTQVTDYSQYITLGQYTGLEITVDAAVVTDEQIQDYKDSCLYYYNNYYVEPEHITTGTTKEGDVINLNYSGKLNGEAFDGGTATDQSYTVGSGKFISDLDTQLAGLEVGKEYELPCTFPEDYSNNPDLAGKEVVFVVTVNYIEGDKDEYEWGDEFVSLYTKGEFTTAAAYEESFTAELLATAQADQQTEFENDLWNKIAENCTFSSYPEDKISGIAEDYLNYYIEYFTYYASLYGMDMATYLSNMYGMTQEDLTAECQTMAQTEVQYIMVACEIYKAQGNTLSDEEYNTRAQEAAATYGFDSAAAFIEEYGEEYVRESFIFDIVSDYVSQNNTMVINK